MQHVLVVDDQPDIRAVVQMGLEDFGHYRVTAAATGHQALLLLDSDPPDLVVLDAVLPGMSGIEVAAHAVCRDIAVLVMTGEPAMDERLARVGWPHVRKPFHIKELLAEVQATIAQGHDNNRTIRASLDRLFQASGDLQRVIDNLGDLRRRAEQSVARSRRLNDKHARSDAADGPLNRRPAMQSVMVLEDDSAFAEAIEACLTRAGFEVEIAPDTFAALTMVEARSFDMHLVDLAMPPGKASGLSFARMLRYRQPRARIIFVTGYPDLAAVAAELPGKVFTKPVDLDAVASEIRSQLAA